MAVPGFHIFFHKEIEFHLSLVNEERELAEWILSGNSFQMFWNVTDKVEKKLLYRHMYTEW